MEDYNDMDMSTPITNLNNSKRQRNMDQDISSIVKDLENKHNNIDNGLMAFNEIDRDNINKNNNNINNNDHTNLREIQETQQLRYNPNYIPDTVEDIEPFENDMINDVNISVKKENDKDIYKTIHEILVFLKYPFILLILFMLISSNEFIVFYENINIIKTLNSYNNNISLIIKSILFVFIFFLVKYLDENPLPKIL
jgi:hypothetical protein